MSSDARDEAASAPADRHDPLTQRQVFELYLTDTALRPYLIGALGGLAMEFLVMLLGRDSDIGAVIVLLYGAAALALRWTAAPPFLLLILFYFCVFPFGVPDGGYDNPFEIRETHFRVADMVLVFSVLVYLLCLYRVLGVVQQAMPFENAVRRKDDRPVRRPTSHVAPGEFARLLAGAGALVLIGQAAWWLANALDFVPADPDFPLRWADSSSLARYRRGGRPPGEYGAGASRFFVMLGALFFGLLLVRLVFGYWRLRAMNAAEGAMVMVDTSWAESHRERVRVERWRIWGRQRAAEDAKKQARAERERHQKEEAARERAAARAQDRGTGSDRPRRRR
ncbi:hypothetical protein [Frigoriglobus tundricola]|uniref:Uncharacterized protein n=1 Tax=Frigoriglobus tundricola TaxID=2774151 RepID=A0A6M5YHD8_9BACT|nr:hypothetical protein [Frigoriglobus tundricola]QJW93479.1 hypothetical protein FTUN_0985 [Frigoriglobus tundricola]